MAAPTYFNSASVPADAGTNATTTLTVTPPGSMTTGDLVVVIGHSRPIAGVTWSLGLSGGQTWTLETAYAGSANSACRIFWCTFNGTWSVNPRFDCSDGTATSAIMHVFRPDATSDVWTVDVAQASTQYAAPTTPFTVSRTGLTTVGSDTVTLACWHSGDDNTWDTLTGTGWVVTGLAQYRNTASSDLSSSYAHHLDAGPAAVVPTTTKNQATLGGDSGVTAIIAWTAGAAAAATSLITSPPHRYQHMLVR
jgi:hypothetical protein